MQYHLLELLLIEHHHLFMTTMIITIPTFPSKEVALFFVQRKKKVKIN